MRPLDGDVQSLNKLEENGWNHSIGCILRPSCFVSVSFKCTSKATNGMTETIRFFGLLSMPLRPESRKDDYSLRSFQTGLVH